MAKTQAQIKREIDGILAGGGAQTTNRFWPGGTGGGGSRRKRPGSAVVRPHAMTSPKCDQCHRFHTQEECARHGGKPPARTKARPKTKAKPKKTTGIKPRARPKKAKAKPKKKKTTKVSAKGKATSPAAPTQTAHRASPTSTTNSEHDPLAIVMSAVRAMPSSGRFGEDKVFISALWRKVNGRIGRPSLDEFKQWLIEQNRMEKLDLVRADLVDAMPPKLVHDSEIRSLGSSFHFVIDRIARDSYRDNYR